MACLLRVDRFDRNGAADHHYHLCGRVYPQSGGADQPQLLLPQFCRTGFSVLSAVLSVGTDYHLHFDADLAYLRSAGQYTSGAQTFDRLDLAHLIDEASESDEPSDQDKDMKLFQNALDFSDLLVRDCMVPRVDIEAIERTESIKTLTERFIDTHFSRLPVYEESIDHIVGYVNTKSLFKQPTSIDEILQKIDYVPESMPAQKLLTSFIKKGHSVAVVIDEFGGTAGMITIEDILEEIFGEIEDEHDDPGLVEKQMGEGEFIFSGRLEVEYINEKYHLDIPESDEYDTLAGYVIDRYQGIPAVGETILDGNRKIRVLRTESSKVELLRITLTSPTVAKSAQN